MKRFGRVARDSVSSIESTSAVSIAPISSLQTAASGRTGPAEKPSGVG